MQAFRTWMFRYLKGSTSALRTELVGHGSRGTYRVMPATSNAGPGFAQMPCESKSRKAEANM